MYYSYWYIKLQTLTSFNLINSFCLFSLSFGTFGFTLKAKVRICEFKFLEDYYSMICENLFKFKNMNILKLSGENAPNLSN